MIRQHSSSDTNIWERVSGRGPGPGCLQGHTMVEHQDVLYVFGGELSFCNDQETPLWMFDIKENSWQKYSAPRGVVTPKGRRGHTAVVHGDCMYIYGGYQVCRAQTRRKVIIGPLCRICEAPPQSYGRSTFPPRPGTWCPRVSGRARGRVRSRPSTITPL